MNEQLFAELAAQSFPEDVGRRERCCDALRKLAADHQRHVSILELELAQWRKFYESKVALIKDLTQEINNVMDNVAAGS